jgi:hypothetical protein
MSKFCKTCGTQLNPGAKFCASCGTKTQEAGASPVNTSPRLVGQGSQGRQNQGAKQPKKLLFSAVAVVLVIALGAAILPRLGKEATNIQGTAGDLSAFTYTARDYMVKAKELTVSPESPSASAHGVTIQFGEYALEGDKTLKIRQLPEKTDKNNGVKVTAYDFELGGQSEFDDVITIAIPYDAKYAEAGAESECIGAKYYHQSTGEGEGVYYEVDAANRQVLIHTTHLSTYGVFQVKNENTRKAYITDVYAIAGLMNTGKSFEVIKELAEQGQPGNAAFEAGFEAVNSRWATPAPRLPPSRWAGSMKAHWLTRWAKGHSTWGWPLPPCRLAMILLTTSQTTKVNSAPFPTSSKILPIMQSAISAPPLCRWALPPLPCLT